MSMAGAPKFWSNLDRRYHGDLQPGSLKGWLQLYLGLSVIHNKLIRGTHIEGTRMAKLGISPTVVVSMDFSFNRELSGK